MPDPHSTPTGQDPIVDPVDPDALVAVFPSARDVVGFCPMGCGRSLRLIAGHVICAAPACPDSERMATIMGDAETEHIVELGEARFAVKHPLRERAHGELLTCGIDAAINAAGVQVGGPPAPPATYRVRFIEGTLSFQQLDDAGPVDTTGAGNG